MKRTLLLAIEAICMPDNGVTDTVWVPGTISLTVVDSLGSLALDLGATDDELTDAIDGVYFANDSRKTTKKASDA